jgi:hypothetical protein
MLSIFIYSTFCFAEDTPPKTNLDIIGTEYNIFSKKILSKYSDSTLINITNHSSKWLLKQALIKQAGDSKILFYGETGAMLRIDINSIKINYSQINSDSISRAISISLFAYENSKVKKIIYDSTICVRDTIPKYSLPSIENKNYSFTKGDYPLQKTSFFDKYIEPVLFSTAAIITTVLLFSVRS